VICRHQLTAVSSWSASCLSSFTSTARLVSRSWTAISCELVSFSLDLSADLEVFSWSVVSSMCLCNTTHSKTKIYSTLLLDVGDDRSLGHDELRPSVGPVLNRNSIMVYVHICINTRPRCAHVRWAVFVQFILVCPATLPSRPQHWLSLLTDSCRSVVILSCIPL